MMYVISGYSGGGKTTPAIALASRGFGISDEPGRKIVREELEAGGSALPWTNPVTFSEKCAELSVHRHTAATQAGAVVLFDRSLVDAISALVFEDPDRAETHLRSLGEYRYASTVFMTPPWPEKLRPPVPEWKADQGRTMA